MKVGGSRMKRKIVSVLMVASMIVGLATGCGSKDSKDSKSVITGG